MATTIVGKIVLMPKGNYNASTTYQPLDWVRYDGASWVCKYPNTVGITPVEGDNWSCIAQNGRDGIDGQDGADGVDGQDGADGTDGKDGSIWLAGNDLSGTGTGITGVAGNENDLYLNTITNNVYQCVSSGTSSTATWNYLCNIKGASGSGSGDMESDTYAPTAKSQGLSNVVDSALSLNGLTASVTELNYMDGVTSAVQTQLNGKVSTEIGKGLSSNDYTTTEKNKLSGIASGAEVNFVKSVETSQLNVNGSGKLSLASQVTSKLVNEVNPTLAGTETAVEGLDIGGTKYKVGGGHTLDTSVTTVEGTTSENQHVPSSYTLKKYANSFKYKFVVEFEEEGNSLGTPIDDKTTWSSATETAAGWIFAEDIQAVRDLFIGLDANESANLDWRFDPVSQDKGLSVARWQFDTATGMMCFVFNRKCSVGTKFSIDLELLRKFDDLI